ncbi:hypothetical protein NQ036_03645 [Brevibacterium sp. 91QC2O2]|uniref:hypothetical protein n=1 Tax=Brevibacterium TaxID=1696 RepID=UPI00211CBCEA|nr:MULTISPECIES: hypothetical protein [unclassified Brevibacterium]MCQ9367340.1 hypothetical protein [Brevibacterium sp. 91QC2O2]MCQ9384647.1 hypothetical protein [Brevibacterium sp. 68QC2CO]
MAKGKIKLNTKAFAQLRNSAEVMADLNRRARKISNAAGEGFEAHDAQPGTKGRNPRARASVGTDSLKGRRRQAQDNVLQKALNAGRQ